MADQGTDKSGTELEIKLELTETDYHEILADIQRNSLPSIFQTNAIIDTPDDRLRETKSMFRVRVETGAQAPEDMRAGEGFLTYKGPSTQVGAAKKRNEVESTYDSDNACIIVLEGKETPLDFLPAPLQRVFKTLGWQLECKTVFKNLRIPIPFPVEEIVTEEPFMLELDRTTFEDGTVDYEVEIEVRELDDVVVVEAAIRKMFDRLGIQFRRQTKGKAQRALAHKKAA
ncbi:MAG: CYTH domain-containing protein [Patescibacteria group bacterium]